MVDFNIVNLIKANGVGLTTQDAMDVLGEMGRGV
jgi:hypothetical protein